MIKNKLNLHKYMFGGKRRKHSIFKKKKHSSKSEEKKTSTPTISLNLPSTPVNSPSGEETKSPSGILKGFFKSNFMSFFKNYIFFIILISICLYILLYIYRDSNNKVVISESKIFFYLVIVFLFIIINDLMSIPLQWLDKFFLFIILSIIIEYVIINLIEYYYKDESFHSKLNKVVISSLIVGVVTSINIYFIFQLKSEKITSELFYSFNYAIRRNSFFLIYLTIFTFIFYYTYYWLNLNSFIGDIFQPTILGSFLLFMVFSLIIYIVYRLKIINKLQILNSFISLYALLFFFGIVFIHIFMNSLKTICTTNISESQMIENDYVSILILISIFIILWYDDSRNWHQRGSILFVFATVITFYSMFYYSIAHPSTATLSLWLFIEWLIIYFRRKENSQNSFNYSFMKT